MKKYTTIATAAIVAASMVSAAQAATMSLSVRYIGSTTATTSTVLAVKDLTNATFQTTSWHHYFEVDGTFTGNGSEAFRNVTIDISTSHITPTTKTGLANLTSNKWFANNPTDASSGVAVFSGSSDGGTQGGDLAAIFIHQDSNDAAQAQQFGTSSFAEGGVPSPLGIFTAEFTSPLANGVNAVITASESGGNSFSFFNSANSNDTDATTQVGGVSSGSYTVAGPVGTPEPASLGLLTLGGLALLARRRKA